MIIDIDNKSFLFLLCNKIEQPIGTLYSTVIPWRFLKKIAYTNPRIFIGYDDNGEEVYSGIQRVISLERQKDISKYISDPDASFPTSIILNIPGEKVIEKDINIDYSIKINHQKNEKINIDFVSLNDYDKHFQEKKIMLIIPYKEGMAQIIDGQHRMSGFETTDDSLVFDLPVTIFLNQDVPSQAEIFAIINGRQTRVTPSLVYDLFGISETRSPYTVARRTVKLLNESEESPLKQSVKILGKSNENYTGFVTQSTISKIIINLISANAKQAEEDKRKIRKGEKPTLIPSLSNTIPALRKYFVNEQDEVIFKVILNFFKAISVVFHKEWNNKESILKKTVGFTALTRLMIKLINDGLLEQDLSQDFFNRKLKDIGEVDFNDIQLSSKGVKQLLDRFNLV